jgi:ATP-dependent exoDNAse (exonuclease V) beta subunit
MSYHFTVVLNGKINVSDIFNKIKANQKVVIGDSHQKIYGFRNGLDIINNFLQNEFTEMPLTISFRFNGEIATIANNLLSNLKSENIRIQGVAPDRNILTKAFITRTNAKIVEISAGMINNNDWKTVRKPDDLFALPMSITKFFINSGINYRIPEDLSFLRIFNSLQELTEYANDVNDIEMMSAIRIAERKAAVINECFFRARQQYNNLNNASVYLTTAHTSKGLEWDEVYLTDDYPDIIGQIRNAIRINNVEKNIENMDLKDIIRRFIEMQHDDRQYRSIQNIVEEINLLYVAVTRARKIVHVDNVDLFNILDQIR